MNVKRQCPICLEKDHNFHSDSVDGDVIQHCGNDRLMCLVCGYDASMDEQWIIENQ
jgi:hypothetical protein